MIILVVIYVKVRHRYIEHTVRACEKLRHEIITAGPKPVKNFLSRDEESQKFDRMQNTRMTHSAKRAANIEKQRDRGIVSAARHSFSCDI